jgi:hypothetical protein
MRDTPSILRLFVILLVATAQCTASISARKRHNPRLDLSEIDNVIKELQTGADYSLIRQITAFSKSKKAATAISGHQWSQILSAMIQRIADSKAAIIVANPDVMGQIQDKDLRILIKAINEKGLLIESLQKALLMDHVAPRLTSDEWMMIVTKVTKRNDPTLIGILESPLIQKKIFKASQKEFDSFASSVAQNSFSHPDLGPLLFRKPYLNKFTKTQKGSILKGLFNHKNPFALTVLKSKAIMADMDDSVQEHILREALAFNKNFDGLIEALVLPWNSIQISSESWTRALLDVTRLQRSDLFALISRNGAILSRLSKDQIAIVSNLIQQFSAFAFEGLYSFLNSPFAMRMPSEHWISIIEQARKKRRRDVIQKIVRSTAVVRRLPESYSTELFQWILLKEAPQGRMSFGDALPLSRTLLASRLSRIAVPLNRAPHPFRNLMH